MHFPPFDVTWNGMFCDLSDPMFMNIQSSIYMSNGDGNKRREYFSKIDLAPHSLKEYLLFDSITVSLKTLC